MTYPLVIGILVPGLPFQGDSIEKQALGGSETAAIYMARGLSGLGHHVTVFSQGLKAAEKFDGVWYRSVDEWQTWARATPHDVSIVQRHPKAFLGRLNSKLNVLWCHDLASARDAGELRGVLWNIDRIIVLSKFMAEQYKQVIGPIDDALWISRNGIDLKMFEGLQGVPRNRKTIICAARPERGIDVLLGIILPQLLKRDPDIKLQLCGYSNQVPQMAPFYAGINQMIEAHGDHVQWLGFLPKAELYKQYATAGAYVYPTPSPTIKAFAEISCISVMEAQAAGLPIVTSKRGALPETIAPNAGHLIKGDPWDEHYPRRFVEAVMSVINAPDEIYDRMSAAGRAKAKQLDWSGVVAEWSEQFERLIIDGNNSPHRLALHFIRHSDIMAAREVLKEVEDPQAKEIKTRLDTSWGFIESVDTTREQYEKIGLTHTDVFEQAAQEPRFQLIEKWLRDHTDLQTILDFGCAHGAYAVNLSNRVGRVWVGVDIDKHSIEWAEKFTAQHAKTPTQLKFVVGNEDVDLVGVWPIQMALDDPPTATGLFDCLLMMETLEHIRAPWEAVNKLERWIKPGGRVFMTVPYGPWEFLSFDSYPHRTHVWEYNFQDLMDMFGDKKQCEVFAVPHAFDEYQNEPLGWFVVTYIVSDVLTKPINMQRKLLLQRPRQTVSASIVAGPGSEDLLGWCLSPLKYLADEIVLADTGMSEDAKRIAQRYGARFVKSADPKVSGFETPRNDGLAACRMDWVLWIDTDERLTDPQFLHKYLRDNIYHGYSIQQHHFACDTVFKPDMPVRLFRRRPHKNGEIMRFFGMIHEHPELGNINDGPGLTVVLPDVRIAHVGYLVESTRKGRFARNLPMLQKDIEKYPERLLQKYFIMRDNMLLAMYETNASGGLLSPENQTRCRSVVETYQKYFLGKETYIAEDAIEYYSQALALLGEGFEAAVYISADKVSAGMDGQKLKKYRFANQEDLKKTLENAAKQAVGQLESVYW